MMAKLFIKKVLMTPDELKEVLDRAIESVKFYLDNGIEKTQNKYN